MFLFGNKKKDDGANKAPARSAPAAMPAPVDADDFFKDMGRKPKNKPVETDIPVPEVTGLREAPLPPPGSSIKTIAEQSTEGLADKSGYDDSFIHGNIKTINTETLDVDTALARRKNQSIMEKEINSTNPDDFFKDIDRRRVESKLKNDIAVPEVTGLREAPAPKPESEIRNAREVSADGLIDKTQVVTEGLGNINAIDTGNIDLSGLRDEQE